jgi:hypothetical protein
MLTKYFTIIICYICPYSKDEISVSQCQRHRIRCGLSVCATGPQTHKLLRLINPCFGALGLLSFEGFKRKISVRRQLFLLHQLRKSVDRRFGSWRREFYGHQEPPLTSASPPSIDLSLLVKWRSRIFLSFLLSIGLRFLILV